MKAKVILGYLGLSLILGSTLAVGHAQAKEVCETIESCRKLQSKVEARLQVLLRNIAPALDNIVTNADGSVRNMNQYDAEKYCQDQGTRLPTARELALVSMSLGAKGISETAKDGFYPVYTLNGAKEKVVDFYFDNTGYKRPAGDLGTHFFWSSSVHPADSYYAYVLYGDDGDFDYFYRSSVVYVYSAVRCVRR